MLKLALFGIPFLNPQNLSLIITIGLVIYIVKNINKPIVDYKPKNIKERLNLWVCYLTILVIIIIVGAIQLYFMSH